MEVIMLWTLDKPYTWLPWFVCQYKPIMQTEANNLLFPLCHI